MAIANQPDSSGSKKPASPARTQTTNTPPAAGSEKSPSGHQKTHPGFDRIFDRFASVITRVTGSPWAFMIALIIVIVWAVTGSVFNYSDTWQLVINTGTTIVTFLMVFVIQQSQNKDTMALQLKLNELIAANKEASNRLIDVEDLTEEELMLLKDYYIRLSAISKKEKELQRSHSIEELETNKRTTPGQRDSSA